MLVELVITFLGLDDILIYEFDKIDEVLKEKNCWLCGSLTTSS